MRIRTVSLNRQPVFTPGVFAQVLLAHGIAENVFDPGRALFRYAHRETGMQRMGFHDAWAAAAALGLSSKGTEDLPMRRCVRDRVVVPERRQ